MNFFKRIFSPPRFENNPEKTRHAQLLYLIAWILFVVLAILSVLSMSIDAEFGNSYTAVLIGLTCLQMVSLVLTNRGYIRESGYLLLILSWMGITLLAASYGGVRNVVLFAYFTIIISAGYLFGWRTVAIFMSGSILAVWVLALYEEWGISKPILESPVSFAINLTGLLIFSSIQIYFVITVMKKALRDADMALKERHRVEERLSNERERLALALSAAKMETWDWQIETGAVSWSDGIEAMFGMAKGQFDGKYDTYLSLIHHDDIQSLQQAINRALSDENYDYVVEHRLIWPSGEVRWQEGRGKVYRNEDGKPIRMAGTTVDITDRKQAEAEREQLIQELAEKNDELEQFTYTVSHDLKAPIITIKGFLGFLGEDVRSGNQQRIDGDIARITEATNKMHRLLNDLLELSRIGRLMNPPEPIPLGELVEEAIEILQGRLQTHPVKLVIAKNLPVIEGDRQRLLEVVQNLIDNAAKFSAGQPAPMVEIGKIDGEDGEPIVFVRDNGIGISSEHHERIFGLFNKLNPEAEGTGVGLALVKRVIEFYGGRIWVQSEASSKDEAGKGTTFFFTLPATGQNRDNLPESN